VGSSPCWDQFQPVARHLLHLRARESQREILTLLPQRQEVVVVRTAWLARLARGARREAAVPVRQAEDMPAGRAAGVLELVVARGGVRGISIAGARRWPEVERLRVGRAERGKRVVKRRGVQSAP